MAGYGVVRGRPGRPRSVLGVSSRSWLAVTAMRRPGREGFVKHRAQVSHELRTPVTLPHESAAPQRMSSQLSAHTADNCELTGGTLEEGARKGDVPGISVTRSHIGEGSVSLPWLSRVPPATIPHHSPHPRPSRPRPQPARAVAETAALTETPCVPYLGRRLREAPSLPRPPASRPRSRLRSPGTALRRPARSPGVGRPRGRGRTRCRRRSRGGSG